MEIIKKPTKKNGRPAAEGKKRQYVIPDDVHAWIMRHGGSKYIVDTFRAIISVTPQEEPSSRYCIGEISQTSAVAATKL